MVMFLFFSLFFWYAGSCSDGQYYTCQQDCTCCKGGRTCYDCSYRSIFCSEPLRCVDCAAGTSCNCTGEVPCKPGFWSYAKSQNCTPCDAGKFSITPRATNSSFCNNCTAGSSSGIGASMCTTCPAGTYSRTNGSSACLSCVAGSYSTGGAQFCSNCAAGSYSTGGAQFCTLCPVVRGSQRGLPPPHAFPLNNPPPLTHHRRTQGTFNPSTNGSSSSFCKKCPPVRFRYSQTSGLPNSLSPPPSTPSIPPPSHRVHTISPPVLLPAQAAPKARLVLSVQIRKLSAFRAPRGFTARVTEAKFRVLPAPSAVSKEASNRQIANPARGLR
jgi:hypothetical protein